MKKIFLDTSVLLSAYNPEDIAHKEAIILLKKAQSEDIIIVLSTFILSETITLVCQRVNKQTGRSLLEELRKGGYIIIHPTERQISLAEKLFNTIDSKNVSYVDCTSFILMQEENIHYAFAFDKHFKTQGFVRVGIDD